MKTFDDKHFMDQYFMDMAYQQAVLAAERNEVPVGAVLVDANNVVLAEDGNRIVELSDPSAHAEMLVIRKASQLLGTPRLIDCRIYSTLEPCPMCATVIAFARLQAVHFGAPDPKGGGIDHGPRIFTQSTCHHRPQVFGNKDAERCGELLRSFFRARR